MSHEPKLDPALTLTTADFPQTAPVAYSVEVRPKQAWWLSYEARSGCRWAPETNPEPRAGLHYVPWIQAARKAFALQHADFSAQGATGWKLIDAIGWFLIKDARHDELTRWLQNPISDVPKCPGCNP